MAWKLRFKCNFPISFPVTKIYLGPGGWGVHEAGRSTAGVTTRAPSAYVDGNGDARPASSEDQARELREVAHAHVVRNTEEQRPAGASYRLAADNAERYTAFVLALGASLPWRWATCSCARWVLPLFTPRKPDWKVTRANTYIRAHTCTYTSVHT